MIVARSYPSGEDTMEARDLTMLKCWDMSVASTMSITRPRRLR